MHGCTATSNVHNYIVQGAAADAVQANKTITALKALCLANTRSDRRSNFMKKRLMQSITHHRHHIMGTSATIYKGTGATIYWGTGATTSWAPVPQYTVARVPPHHGHQCHNIQWHGCHHIMGTSATIYNGLVLELSMEQTKPHHRHECHNIQWHERSNIIGTGATTPTGMSAGMHLHTSATTLTILRSMRSNKCMESLPVGH